MIAGPERLMLLEGVAPLIGLAPSTLAEHCRRGRFPYRRLPGTRRYLFAPADVPAYLDGCELEVTHLAGNGLIVRPKKGRSSSAAKWDKPRELGSMALRPYERWREPDAREHLTRSQVTSAGTDRVT